MGQTFRQMPQRMHLASKLRPLRAGRADQARAGADGGRLRGEQPDGHHRGACRSDELPPRRVVGQSRGGAEVAGEVLAGLGADRDAVQAQGAFGRVAGEMARWVDGAGRAGAGTALAVHTGIAYGPAQPGHPAHQPQQGAEWT